MNSQKMHRITLKHLLIKGEKKIGLQFYPNKVLNALVKGLPGVRWSNTLTVVHVPNTKEEHLLKVGTDLRKIHSLSGHNSLKTTEIYTHVAINYEVNIRNPLDSVHLK